MAALAPALMPYLRRPPAPSDEAALGSGGGGGGGGQGPDGDEADAEVAALVGDGVVRISLLHYNTEAEVDGLLVALREALA
jgi:selenocysteine lyase/cysteine desulfurase